jgi:ABC-2 type transport system permease protein
MRVSGYASFELLRTFRNRRFLLFSLGIPIVLYLAIAGPNRNENDLGGSGISAPLYLMVGLAAFGSMNAMLGAGARIAAERQAGWNRQLRITPPAAHVLPHESPHGLPTAGATIVLLYAAGISLGVSLSAGSWCA